MENLFMYGIGGADLDDCDSFLTGLDAQANKCDNQDSQSGVYIPSPQGMLNTGLDPYAAAEQYDQMFIMDEGQWDLPIDTNKRAPTSEISKAADIDNEVDATHALPSPPIKSESDSSPYEDECYLPDTRDIAVESSGVAKRGSLRQRKTKTSHNMIEKRYRNNINDKINILRDSVPTLREAAATTVVDGIPSIRLNKATVLTKAAEYIEQLKTRNRHLQKENSELRARVTNNRRPPYAAPPPMHQTQHVINRAQPPQQSPHSHGQQSQNHQGPNQQAHYIPQQPPQRPIIGSNVALGCASAGLVAAGSILNSGDGNFRGLSAVPFSLNWIAAPSSSSIKFTAVATACLLIGCVWVSLLSKWSNGIEKIQGNDHDMLTPHTNQRSSVREIAIARLGLPRQPTLFQDYTRILVLFPQVIVAIVFGSRYLEAIKAVFGHPSDPQAGHYLEELIDTNMTSKHKVRSIKTVITFMMTFVHPSPRSSMLQALLLKQMVSSYPLVGYLTPFINRLWMRKNSQLPPHLQALSDIPLTEITDVDNTHIIMTRNGVEVSDFVSHNTADPQILNILDLFACLHVYALQDRCMLSLMTSGEADLTLLDTCAKIVPPNTHAALNCSGLQALFASDNYSFDKALKDISKELADHPVQKCFPELMACAMTKSLSRDPDAAAYAENILADRDLQLSSIHSNMVFVAYYIALKTLYKRGLGRSNLLCATLEVRVWLGSPASGLFGLSKERRKELIDETLKFAHTFASRESDEACSIPDEVVDAALSEN